MNPTLCTHCEDPMISEINLARLNAGITTCIGCAKKTKKKKQITIFNGEDPENNIIVDQIGKTLGRENT